MILKQLNPAIDKVGIMVFPGMSKSWTASCSSSPSIEPYGTTGIIYQINGSTLETTYANPQGTLNDSDPLVVAVGDNSKGKTRCLQTPGGEGTFYADAIAAAQAALQAEGSSTAQNVIILLTDGAANQAPLDGHMDATYAVTKCSGTPSACSPGHEQQQCNQAVVAAQAATRAGTWVYVIAYDADVSVYDGSSNTGCPSNNPATNITANGSISKSVTKITTLDVATNYPWAALFGVAGTNCQNCSISDSTKTGVISSTTKISSWTGTTLTLNAATTAAGSGASDTLLITSPNTVYDSPTGTSQSQWSPCAALQNMASSPAKFFSANSNSSSGCTSVNPYTNVATSFQQAGYSLSQPRLVLGQ